MRAILDQILLLLHPVMPFVTEEIWQVLGNQRESIMVQPYPRSGSMLDLMHEVERQMEFLMDIVRAIRNLRTEMNCPPGKEVKVIFCGAEEELGLFARAGALSPVARARGRGRISRRPAIGPKERRLRWSAPQKFICRSMI